MRVMFSLKNHSFGVSKLPLQNLAHDNSLFQRLGIPDYLNIVLQYFLLRPLLERGEFTVVDNGVFKSQRLLE